MPDASLAHILAVRRPPWDNAVAESFFATIEHELIWGQDFKTRDQAQQAIFEYIEVFYNRQRSIRRSTIDPQWIFKRRWMQPNSSVR